MTHLPFVGMAFAVCSAVLNSCGMVIEKLAVRRMPEIHARRTVEMITTLFAAPLWVTGFLLLAAGLGSQVLALTLAPISLAQAVFACGIVLLLVLCHIVLGDRLGKFEYGGIALVVSGLVLRRLSVDPRADQARTGGRLAALFLADLPAVVVSLGLFVLAERLRRGGLRRARLSSCAYGVSAGLLYGVAGLAVKWVSTIVQRRGILDSVPRVLASPALYVFLACAIVGFLIFQTALQRSVASILVPLNNVTGSAFFIAVGGFIFHEPLPRALAPLVLRLSAFALIAGALVVLGRGGEAGEASDLHLAGELPSAAVAEPTPELALSIGEERARLRPAEGDAQHSAG